MYQNNLMTNAVKTWILQCIFGLVAVIGLTLWHQQFFLSALLGVLSMMFACSYWVYSLWRIEKNFGKQKARPVRAFYFGQIIKYILLIILLIVYIYTLQLNLLAVIIGILAIQIANIFLTFKTKGMPTP